MSASRRAVGAAAPPPGGGSPPAYAAACAALLAAAVVSFCLGYVLAVSAPGVSFSWRDNMVSDLGDRGCREWDGLWICSPRSGWFDAALIACGACVLAATALMTLVARRWGVVLGVTTAGLGVGLVLIGAVPSDVAQGVHMVGAVLTLPVAAAGILASAIRPGTPWLHRGRGARGTLGAVALTLCLDHLAAGPAPLPRGLAETGAVAAILAFLALESARCLRWARAPGR